MDPQKTELSEQSDVEKGFRGYAHLTNTIVHSFAWEDVTVTVPDRQTKESKTILSSINGIVKAGELLAIMGPSGSGKTTLLDILAHRKTSNNATIRKSIYLNGNATTDVELRQISAYVEQEEALTGALTVEETLYFAAKLSLPSSISKTERLQRIQDLLTAFGLADQANTLIGTPIRKGISGGQKRRVSVASQLITNPRILFLDEPTSGLDSTASFEVMSFVRQIVKQHNLIVISSIHQPSTSTFGLFDKLLLLSGGKTVYNGKVEDVQPWFDSVGSALPKYTNPAEHLLDLVSIDFASDREAARQKLDSLVAAWSRSLSSNAAATSIETEAEHQQIKAGAVMTAEPEHSGKANPFLIPVTLIHRSLIKSYRDIVAYGIRIAMYMGLAIMMGTVWLRLGTTQNNIQAFINSIFFGGAFMSFMAVAYIPSYLEDRAIFVRERANGLYGPTAFLVANFTIGLPFLFLITMLFSVIAYWLGNFRPTASAFWYWVMWLFLDLVAAESLVVLLSSLVPIFVVALAATAFANGLWMSVGGFLVPTHTLNVFWRYVFHFIDYQAYVFQGMMVNEFEGRSYSCGSDCRCMYPSDLERQCKIDGKAVLSAYGYKTGKTGEWVGILIAIVAVYRLLAWLVLYLKKT